VNCCLCSEQFELGQRIIKLTIYRVEWSAEIQQLVPVPAMFRDETVERWAHDKCVALIGTPPVLTGDDPNWRRDV
jgi:hypothetical protein